MANIALKSLFKTDLVETIRDVLSGSSNYYLFVGRATPFTDDPTTATNTESDTNPPSIAESSRNVYDSMRNGIFIKRIFPENMKLVVPRIDWASGTAYTAYSETTDMDGKNFYVFTNENNVYKCLRAKGVSTVMPTGRSTQAINLSDGYTWKFIYSVPEDYLGHLTLDYIPVFLAGEENPEQREVQNSAQAGSIDSVSMTASLSPTFGKIYKNERFFTSVNTVPQLGVTSNVAGSTIVTFSIEGEALDTVAVNGYWNDYAIHVTSGPGVGQYMRIVDFKKSPGAGVSYYYAQVHPPLDRPVVALSSVTTASDASKFKIVPYMVVDGDGDNAVVVPRTTTEQKIESLSILNPGRNYTSAQPRIVSEAANALIGSAITNLNASISASLSIPKGHGFNAVRELKAASLMMVVEVDGTENGKISTRNDYRQFGIIKNPMLYGGITFAGASDQQILKVLVKKQPTKDSNYSLATFVPGSYIMGKESRATARIVDTDTIVPSRSTMYRLYLSDIKGDFRLSDDGSNKVRVYYGATFSAPFATGDIARQYSGTVGITLSAYGTITSYDLYGRNVVIDTTFGAFATDKQISFANGGYTMNPTSIIDLDEEFGESIGQVTFGNTGGSQFLNFNGDEIFGRLASTEFTAVPTEDIGRYDLTTKVRIVSASTPFTDGILFGTSAVDGTITQTNGTTLVRTVADIMDFTVSGGSGLTGTIRLSNVKGNLNTTDPLFFTPYGSTASNELTSTSINQITYPDIEIGSGEMLYIENVRPIQRNQEQSEEFKIVIGF